MKAHQILCAALAASVLSVMALGAQAQRGAPYYGGYYGFFDPTITVTPFGIQSMGYGYNGFTGSGFATNPDWEILRAIYAQGYQDAANAAPDGSETSYATGMTATPRTAYSGRVPHGSDGVRMWRVGRGQIALRWQGDPRIASSVTFALMDRSGRTLRRTTVNQLPAEVRFTPPANAVYYQATVHYTDGATNTIMSRLLR